MRNGKVFRLENAFYGSNSKKRSLKPESNLPKRTIRKRILIEVGRAEKFQRKSLKIWTDLKNLATNLQGVSPVRIFICLRETKSPLAFWIVMMNSKSKSRTAS